MSITSYLRNLFPPTQSEKEQLIKESKKLANKLLPERTAQEKLKKARSYADGFFGTDRWKAWRWLIRTHRSANAQLQYPKDSREKIEQAKKLWQKEDHPNEFLSGFSTFVEKEGGLESLEKEIKKSQKSWSDVEKTIHRVRPRVFLTHAFLKLSESSGVEIASLFIGGLIALGAIYMAFYYETAAGQSVVAYWTLSDLIIQGIRVIPLVIFGLVIAEIIFFLWGREWSYRLHGIVLKYPLPLVLAFFLVSAVGATIFGHVGGVSKFKQFISLEQNDAEMATVMDESVLTDVFLVGTTDRTATFLQVTDWKADRVKQRQGYFLSLSCVASAFLPRSECDRGDPHPNFHVLVMDRALVVCHAKKDQCPRKDNLANDEGDQLTAIE